MVSLESFFLAEWNVRRAGEHRSLRRARDLAEVLGAAEPAVPVLCVVGSKGKGTAATYASAFLAAAGRRVVTVTSPGYRRASERIRVNGRAISATELSRLARRLRDGVRKLPPRAAYDGYLAPTGLFTLAGVLHAGDAGADVIVLEAGMGGASDEVSLFPATVVAITPVFAEHLGKLGNTVAEIAREKAAVVSPRTRAVLTVPQTADVRQAIADTAGRRRKAAAQPRSGATVSSATVAGPPGEVLAAVQPVAVVTAASTTIPARLLPPGLGAVNAGLGCAAAATLLDVTGQPQPPAARLATALGSVRLPGRLSRHELPGTPTELIVDSAINGPGIAAALAVARSWWSGVDHVVACLPDHKDVAGAIGELAGLPVTFARLPDAHLRFTHPLPPHWAVTDAEDLTRTAVAGLGRRVLTVGTVYFAGRMLDLADADTECLFAVP